MAKGKEEDIEKQEVSLKELREDLYRLRDFEISNLWQRSIFLSAMIVVLFSGYGSLLSKIIDKKESLLLINEICSAISLIGLVFSIIWIMMAKGSKAWYEVYERKINIIEGETELKINRKYLMNTTECDPKTLDSNLLTNSGGKYSVSKLNIFIGKILAIFWSTTFIIHIIGIINNIKYNIFSNISIGSLLSYVFIILFIVILITARMNLWAESNSLKEATTKKYTFQIITDNLRLDKDAWFTKEDCAEQYKTLLCAECELLDKKDLLNVILTTYKKQKSRGWIEYMHGIVFIKCYQKTNKKRVCKFQDDSKTNEIIYIVAY